MERLEPRATKVLVTDDHADMLALEAGLLEEAGYEVLEARSGRECLALARAHHPDIVLLDVVLPDMSGVAVCKRIKGDQDLRSTLVMLVSGVRVSSEYQADGLNVGADGYMTKPISNKEFLARVHALARIGQVEDALRNKEAEQQKLISELQAALAEIKTLKGFIPICASCKNIRDDEGYWDRVEAYISKHTDAVFTHGICPQCEEKYRSQISKIVKEM
jgi:CheY-like chemotaxis protein